ncbi:MAG: ribonuclease H-like domain-containing protein [Candidatus Moranbacteria bacterium]|nr:ribonuclease H-like domain-containing protein [Candidatus Moranbacteria bacterium]
MSTLVLDIETIGEDFEQMDDVTKRMLTRWVKNGSLGAEEQEREIENVKNGLGFSPLTGQVVAIGMLDYEKNKSAVYFQAPGETLGNFEENGVMYKQMTEVEMLEAFWRVCENYDQFVTFNGRGFDAPFLAIRSAIHKIKPSKDLLSNRYLGMQKFGAKHFDLQDLFTFYGSTMRRPSLHLACRAFGIVSPKVEGVDGDDVTRLFAEKKFLDIARYNVRDIVATKELYAYWEQYMKFER